LVYDRLAGRQSGQQLAGVSLSDASLPQLGQQRFIDGRGGLNRLSRRLRGRRHFHRHRPLGRCELEALLPRPAGGLGAIASRRLDPAPAFRPGSAIGVILCAVPEHQLETLVVGHRLKRPLGNVTVRHQLIERWSELSFNFRTVPVEAYPQQVTHIYVPLLKPSIALRGKQPLLQMRYEVLGDIGFQFDVSGQFDRDEVAGVDIVELPFRKPDVVLSAMRPSGSCLPTMTTRSTA
jgi:hypothetical protein